MTEQSLLELKKFTASINVKDLDIAEHTRVVKEHQEEFDLIVKAIRSAAAQWYYLGEAHMKVRLSETLSGIYMSAVQLNNRRRKLTAALRESECNPALEVLHQYEEQLTLLYSLFVKRFLRFFDHSSPLPPLTRESNRQAIKLLIQRISAAMRSNQISRSLTEILLAPLHHFLQSAGPLSFQEFAKIFYYRKALLALLSEKIINKAAVCRMLHEQGCNSLRFLNWQTKYLRTYAGRYRALADQVTFYQFQLKVCRQGTPGPPWLREDGPTSIERLDNWLSCEIDYLKQKSAALLARKQAAEEHECKATLAITVPQLGCFARLLIETKILRNTNVTDLMRRICTLVSTDYTARISPYSLLKKSQNIEPGTLDEVKTYLIAMLNEARNYGQAS